MYPKPRPFGNTIEKEERMPRNTIQKRFAQTLVEGYVIEEGAPQKVAFTLPKKVGIAAAQAIVRREHDSFSATSVTHTDILYKMDFDTFKQYATVVDADEE